jgi:tetratricopeptide (TPR) repeat protein
MKRAAKLAWDKKWSRAIEEYEKALAEFPQDVTALTGLGLAYTETKQLPKALTTYQKAAELSKDNPEVIQRVANMHERLAQWPAAAQAYVQAAEAYMHLRDTAQAVEMWQKATMFDPQNLDARQNLAMAYQSQGQVRKAARQQLIMARIQERQGYIPNAIEHCNLALKLDPRNTEAPEILAALQQATELPDGPTARVPLDIDGKRTLDSFVVFEDIEVKSAALLDAEKRASPADMVRDQYLSQMAEALFSEAANPKMMQANLLLAQGADFQNRGLTDKALGAYQSALQMGTDTTAVRFCMGLLYWEKRDFDQAIEYLRQALSDEECALGAHFAIGECYREWGKTQRALQHALEALRTIDVQTVSESQTSEIDAIYEYIAQDYATQGESEAVRRLTRSISSFLSGQGWGQQVLETRKRLNHIASGSIAITLAEALAEPKFQVATTAIGTVHDYLQKNWPFTALEECYWAIQQAPYFLPLHLQMADIMIKEGRLEEAVHKYITVAETYQMRKNLRRALTIYRKALEIAPMDVQVREQLIELLLHASMIDQAIEQYMAVADSYYQLAQVNRAIEKYSEALKYAAKGDPARHWEVNVLHRIGDIYMQRLDWQQAIRAYRRIRRIDDQDSKARLYLVDLCFKTGQPEQALSELEDLIEFYKAERQPQRLLSAVQDIVRSHPDELALHMRLARLYVSMRMKKEAIAELDTVGEIQLRTGMTQEAIRTIQAIIRLGPDNVQGYHQLLAQIKGP